MTTEAEVLTGAGGVGEREGTDPKAMGVMFLNRAMEIVQANLASAEVPEATRLRILKAIDRQLQPIELQAVKQRANDAFQIRWLRIFFFTAALGLGIVGFLIKRVEPRALGAAWGILMDRQQVNAQAAARAMDIGLQQVTLWIHEAENDGQASTQDRNTRIENLRKIGNWFSEQQKIFTSVADACAKVEKPERISASTYVEDPFTRMKLPLNRKKGGSLDAEALNNFLAKDRYFIAFLALARIHSQRGAQPIGNSPGDWANAVTPEAVAETRKAFGMLGEEVDKKTAEKRAK